MLLKSREVIAVNQDPLGVAGDRVWKQGPYEVPVMPHSCITKQRQPLTYLGYRQASLLSGWSKSCGASRRELGRRRCTSNLSAAYNDVQRRGVRACRRRHPVVPRL